ncbi:MAG: DUF2973 domain-containing protein [Cyanobacteria bacterium P01_F01_bin.86]
MLHALYIVAFTILAVLAIGNLIRNLVVLGIDARRPAGGNVPDRANPNTPHPEMLDDTGRVVDEPLLVMRSISLEDAREQLDALFEGSAGPSDTPSDED